MRSFLSQKVKALKKQIGPGIITGAADDDPSGIATYSQTGAQFGYGMLWTALYMLPFMAAVQEACGRIGAVTSKGIAAVVKERYPKYTLILLVGLVLIANIFNIGADIAAMASATQLLLPVPFFLAACFFALFSVGLEVLLPYKTYAKVLKWLCLSLLAYPITVAIVKQPWLEVFRSTFIPHFEFNFQFLFIITGVLGTTISPYMFFWQASEQVEEIRENRPVLNKNFFANLSLETFIGMFFSELATWSIILTTATVLHQHGVTDIKSAADAARALEPLVVDFPNAGYLAKIIFATGIIGLGLLGIPVLAGSAAYALSEALGWGGSLNDKFNKAKGFYGIIIVSTLLGLSLNYLGINPVRSLLYAAVLNGAVAVPLIFLIAKISSDPKIMGDQVSGPIGKSLIWSTFICLSLSVLGMLFFRWGF